MTIKGLKRRPVGLQSQWAKDLRTFGFVGANPHLAITPRWISGTREVTWDMCNITHLPTGTTISRNWKLPNDARKVVAVLTELPINWGLLTQKNVKRMTRKVPPKLYNWLSREIRYAD